MKSCIQFISEKPIIFTSLKWREKFRQSNGEFRLYLSVNRWEQIPSLLNAQVEILQTYAKVDFLRRIVNNCFVSREWITAEYATSTGDQTKRSGTLIHALIISDLYTPNPTDN